MLLTTTKENIAKMGHPTFNNGMHTLIELDHLEAPDTHTVTLKLPHEEYLTVSVMPFKGGKSGTVDFKYHGNAYHHVIGFLNKNNKDERIGKCNLYTLTFDSNKTEEPDAEITTVKDLCNSMPKNVAYACLGKWYYNWNPDELHDEKEKKRCTTISEKLEDLGYRLVDPTEDGLYNDIKGYMGCKIEPIA